MGTGDVAGVGIDFYKWVLGSLSCSRGRGGGYRRLNPPVRKRVRLARLERRKLRSFKGRRLRFSWFSPFALVLAKLRDSYVHLLQAASNKLAATSDSISSGPFSALPYYGTPCVSSSDFKAKDRELNRLLQLYLARTRTHLILAPPAAADDI